MAIQALSNISVRKSTQTSSLLVSNSSSAAQTGSLNLTYSTGTKIGKGALNLFFGAGSFSMRDTAGGIIAASLEVVSIGLLIASGYELTDTEYYESYDGSLYGGSGGWEQRERTSYYYPLGWMAYPGYILLAGAVVFDFVRPFSYDKALAKKGGLAFDPSNINLALLPARNGTQSVSMSYTFNF
jgi:hypothetical protein